MSQPGRRSARRSRSINPTAVIGLVLVVLTVGVLLVAQPHEPESRATPPEESVLTTSSVGCPAGLPGHDEVLVASGAQEKVVGDVDLSAGKEKRRMTVATGRVASDPGHPDPVTVTGTGGLAPALVAARLGDGPPAAVDCPSPRPESWFTGMGAGTNHDSVLELVNPDDGPAVADVAVYAQGGKVDVPELRGVTVSGHDSVRIDLAEAMPRRGELALQVVVSRGRLAASVLDRIPELGARQLSEDWLAPQSEPSTKSLLLGLAPGRGSDTLAIANPGADEARVTVKIVTPDSAFAPEGLKELRVPPGDVRTTTLTDVVRRAVDQGAIGLQVTSTAPVSSSLRSVLDDDLSHPAPVAPIQAPSTLLLPPGKASVLLADAGGVGVATVESWTADGKQLKTQKVEVKPGQGAVVDLPSGAALVRVTPTRTTVHAATLVTSPSGAAVVGFHDPLTQALIPDVRPGLP